MKRGGRSNTSYGKLDPATMDKVVYAHLGSPSEAVLVGPKRGFDNAFVSVKGRGVMVVSTDPVSIIPTIGMKRSAWLSVHLIASDFATSGVAPEFASFSLNLPPKMNSRDKEEYLTALGDSCKEIGVSIVAGHTGTYPGASFTVVGGGTMIGFTEIRKYVDPSMALTGDSILMTKGAAIEATAYLAASFPRFTETAVGKKLAQEARRMLDDCTTFKDARVASSMGLGARGVTSMHDATEGGVLGGLQEMARASGHSFIVDKDALFVSKAARRICSAFGVEPLTSLSEGTLLLTCRPAMVRGLVDGLGAAGIDAFEVGSVGKGEGLWLGGPGQRRKRGSDGQDGYWKAYERSVALGRK